MSAKEVVIPELTCKTLDPRLDMWVMPIWFSFMRKYYTIHKKTDNIVCSSSPSTFFFKVSVSQSEKNNKFIVSDVSLMYL